MHMRACMLSHGSHQLPVAACNNKSPVDSFMHQSTDKETSACANPAAQHCGMCWFMLCSDQLPCTTHHCSSHSEIAKDANPAPAKVFTESALLEQHTECSNI